MKTKEITISSDELSILFGFKNRNYISELVKEKGLPKISWNKFNLFDAVKWYISYKDKLHKEEMEKLKSENAQDELTRENTKMRKLQYQKSIGELVEKEEVEHRWVDEVKTFNKALRVVPNKIMPKLKPLFKTSADAITALKIIAEEINEPCNRLSETSIVKRKKVNG